MKKLHALTLVFGLCLIAQPLLSIEYYINTSYTATGSGTTQITTLTGGSWDDGYYDLTLTAGERFYFYGKLVTHVRIWTNGYVTFGFGAPPTDLMDYSPDPIPSTDNPNSYAAPWWQDWDLTTTGELWYFMANHVTIIEWRAVPHRNDPSSAYTFMVAFFNPDYTIFPQYASNNILFIYSTKTSGVGTYDNGYNATIGVEHYTGTHATVFAQSEAAPLSGVDRILCVPFVPTYDSTDFTPGGNVDITVYRPSTGQWFIDDLAGNQTTVNFGAKHDVPLPGDYDGNGDADICILRPTGDFFRWRVQSPSMDVYWGTPGDIPVPADYDGDGITDIAVFRPWQGKWRIKYGAGGDATFYFGTKGDIAVPYDYDNDGSVDVAIVRPVGSYYMWRILYSGGGQGTFYFGAVGDIPVPGNWDNYARQAIFRPSSGLWRHNGTYTPSYYWGTEGDIPVPNDNNKGGVTDWAIWRPTTGTWRIRGNTYMGPTFDSTHSLGQLGDIPRCRWSASIRATYGADR